MEGVPDAESISLSRRGLLGVAGAAVVAGCTRAAHPTAAAPSSGGYASTLEAAVSGAWRSAADRARDHWRHPVQSLGFWGVKPGATVVEFWPGAGWYTEIIAPFLHSAGGVLYAADMPPDTEAARLVGGAYRHKLTSDPGLYGQVRLTTFGPASGPVAPAGSADVVLFLRNLHDWMAGGFADKAFRDAFQALKPGGVLGVEEHRAPAGGVQDVLATSGYVQEAYVRQMAQEAGFSFGGASEINANPKDTADYPFGVWTLPPTRLSAPRGQPADPTFDHTRYDAIGESDRMTLRFIKPA